MDARQWAENLVGRTVAGRYRLDAVLGIGGMGAVFRCQHLGLQRTVALKVLIPQLVDDDRSTKRFQREAQAAAAAARHGVAEVLDFDVDPVCGPFLVMEYLQGESLADRLRREPQLPLEEAVGIVRSILLTLAAVHAQGIVHRDLKPGNVFLATTPDGGRAIKILDFGLVRLVRREFHTQLTQPGAVLGTPAFMSPEQVLGDSGVDQRTDLYAAGALLYTCLGGRRLFEGRPADVLAAVVKHSFTPLAQLRPGLPEGIHAVVERALARERDRRFPDAQSMADALGTALSTPVRPPSASAVPGASRPPREVSVPPVAVSAVPPVVPSAAAVPSAARTVPPAAPQRGASRPWLIPALAVAVLSALALGVWIGRATAPREVVEAVAPARPEGAASAGLVPSDGGPEALGAPVAPVPLAAAPLAAQGGGCPSPEGFPPGRKYLAGADEMYAEAVSKIADDSRPVVMARLAEQDFDGAAASYIDVLRIPLAWVGQGYPRLLGGIGDFTADVARLFVESMPAPTAEEVVRDRDCLTERPEYEFAHRVIDGLQPLVDDESEACLRVARARIEERVADLYLGLPGISVARQQGAEALSEAAKIWQEAADEGPSAGRCAEAARQGVEHIRARLAGREEPDAGSPPGPTAADTVEPRRPVDASGDRSPREAGPAAESEVGWRSCQVRNGEFVGCAAQLYTGSAVIQHTNGWIDACHVAGGSWDVCTHYTGTYIDYCNGAYREIRVSNGRANTCGAPATGQIFLSR